MIPPRARPLLALVAALVAAPACRYDLDRLRGTRDATMPEDAPGDVADAMDILDAVADAPDADADTDAREPVDAPDVPEPIPCTSRPAPNAVDVGTRIGPSLVISADTVGAPSMLTPPTFGSGCPLDYSASPSPERVYRYVVERGPQLYATTDAPSCAGVFDTIVSIRTSCEQGRGQTLACDDDDAVISGCTCGSEGCPSLASSAIATGLVPGQVVYVVVDGYANRAGRFRLVLTENAGANVPPPPPSPSYLRADRCGCPGAMDTAVVSVPFPSAGDTVSGSSTTRLQQPGDQLSGTRRLSLSRVAGAALEFRLVRNDLVTDTRCIDTRAVLDLLVANTVVHSFEVRADAPTAVPLRAAYQTVAPFALPVGVAVSLGLRLREIVPAGCGSIEIERGAPGGTLTLLGGS